MSEHGIDKTPELILGLLMYPILKAKDPSSVRGISERLPPRCPSCKQSINPKLGHFCKVNPHIRWHGGPNKKTSPTQPFDPTMDPVNREWMINAGLMEEKK